MRDEAGHWITPEQELREREPARMCQRCYGEIPAGSACLSCGVREHDETDMDPKRRP